MDIRFWSAMVLCALAAFGSITLALQYVVMVWVLRKPPQLEGPTPGITILKPLAGNEDELWKNLESYADLPYPEYEVLLGVKDEQDEAWPVAEKAVAQWPHRFKLFKQEDSPGANPKVNQLATLSRHARYEILLISDSNTRFHRDGLKELGVIFSDPEVGVSSNPVSGTGHITLPAMMDNLYLVSMVGPGQISSKALVNKDLIVGKSMALTKTVLKGLGGFESMGNYLAEDYVIGVKTRADLKKKIAICKLPVWNVAVHKTWSQFRRRYRRWAIIHRTSVTFPTSFGQMLLTPWPLAVYALALWPSVPVAAFLLGTMTFKVVNDLLLAKALECGPLGPRAVVAVVFKDFFIHIFWWYGLFRRNIVWRGNKLRVKQGSHLVNRDGSPLPGWESNLEPNPDPNAPNE